MISAGVAIIIPTYNRATFLRGAVDSALGQTKRCDVIVVDHGSTDSTPEVAKSFPTEVTYLRRERDLGVHFCWLEGVLSTNAEYVKILFDDDLLGPTFVENSLALMAPDTGFVMSRARTIDRVSGEKIESFFSLNGLNTGIFRIRSRVGRRVRKMMISPSAIFLRRKDALDALYQGDLPLQTKSYKGVGPDHFMKLLTCLRYRNFGFINEELVEFGVHPTSITIDAHADSNSLEALQSAYREVEFFARTLELSLPIYLLRARVIEAGPWTAFRGLIVQVKNFFRGRK